MTDAPTTRETADHAELARLAEAATQGPWSMRTYRTDNARVFNAYDSERRIIARVHEGSPKRAEANSAFIVAANPATVLSLLSEIAALRGERDDWKVRVAAMEGEREALQDNLRIARDDDLYHLQQATQAERQRDELRKALKRIAGGNATCDGFQDAQDIAGQALANQGAE